MKHAMFITFIFCYLLMISGESEASVAFRSKTFTYNASAAAITATEPAGATTNDILLMFVAIDSATGFTGPSGWTQLYALPGSVSDVYVYWIRRGATPPSFALSWTGTKWVEVSVTAWSGAVTSGNPYDVAAYKARAFASPSNPDCPAVVTTVPDTLVLALGMSWNSWSAGGAGVPSGYSIIETSNSVNDLAIAVKVKPTAGTEDPPTFTNANSAIAETGEITIALKPQIPNTSNIPTAAMVQNCYSYTNSSSATCTLVGNITAGDLLVVRSKTATAASSSATPTITTTSGVTLTWNAFSTPPQFCTGSNCTTNRSNVVLGYAIAPSTGTQTIQVTWAASSASFTDISVAEYTATLGWTAVPLDQKTYSTSGTTYNHGTSATTGTTSALSQADEFVIAIVDTWTTAQTWSDVSGFSNRSELSTNTAGWFEKNVSNSSAVSLTSAIADDVWVGQIATFKMNMPSNKIFHRVIQD
jgi:hypothetical protein